jgi:hypothetical protein
MGNSLRGYGPVVLKTAELDGLRNLTRSVTLLPVAEVPSSSLGFDPDCLDRGFWVFSFAAREFWEIVPPLSSTSFLVHYYHYCHSTKYIR